MKYTPGTPTTGNFDVTTPQPLDIKHYFADSADLIDVVGNDPLSYYEGMIVQDVDTGQKYRWIESTVGEIPGGYTYGIYSFDSVVYTGRTFNWIPFGSQLVLFEVGDTFPPLENYGQGTVAIRPYVVGPDTFTGVYEKTDNVAPGTWNELMTFASSVDASFIETTVIAMFAGTGGDFGSADTIARSDHAHNATYSVLGHNHNLVYSPLGHNHDADYMPLTQEGLLYKADLIDIVVNPTDIDDMDNAMDVGIYIAHRGDHLPANFATALNLNTTLTASVGFYVHVEYIGSTNQGIIQTIYDERGPLCWRKTNGAGAWILPTWTRFEATAAEAIALSQDKIISPYALKQHETWIEVTQITANPLLNSYGGHFFYRKRTDGTIELVGFINHSTGSDSPFFQLPVSYRPTGKVTKAGVFHSAVPGISEFAEVMVADSGNCYISYGATIGEGWYRFHFIYSLDIPSDIS